MVEEAVETKGEKTMSIERTAGLDMLPEDEVTLEPSWIKWTNRCQDEHSMRYQVAHSHKTSATGSASWNDSNWLGESPSDAGCELSERLHGLE